MVTPRTILVPYDFTAASKRACDYAIALAAAVGARLRLVHVLEHVSGALTATEHARLTASAEKKLERAATLIRTSVPGVPGVETCLVEGSPWAGIEAVARDGGADLIVMGTHGRRGLARALLGSVDSRAVRMSTVPVTTVPEYVAVSRSAAGMRLAEELAKRELQSPNVVALSRGALTVATAVAERLSGSVDLWAVEPIARDDGVVIGAIGEDGLVMYDAGASELSDGDAGEVRPRHRGRAREEGVLGARRRLSSELVALKGARSIGECWQLDVILVADGLFSASIANVAIAALRKLGPRRMIVATPVIARSVRQHLEAKVPLVDAVVSLETALLADRCVYRDDVLPSDVVAYELILAPHAHAS